MKREIEMQVSQGARRSFLSLLFASLCGYTAAVSGQEKQRPQGQEKQSSQKIKPHSGKPYSGTSKKGNIEEALQMAINAALKAAGGADRQVDWTLQQISGRAGGIAPLNELMVKIDATVI